ncbi:hypothetical protein ACHAWO_013449 [Cyclotella atomus]|uniref:Cytochrome b5 heme-binding domain-containing protein n=1 Tax=Cyclotella atomus TaxID=382360 RepID=A0ABD3PC04_9STRA
MNRKQAPKAKVSQDTAAPCATKSPCPVRSKAREEGLVLYDGLWYSVGKFVPHHPGGAEVLQQYLGTDISFVFRVMHRDPDKIMKYRKPVRAAAPDEMKVLTERRSEICKDMMDEYQTKYKASPAKGMMQNLHPDKFDLESFEKDATSLWKQFIQLGYFKPSRLWIIKNTIALYALLASSIICMKVLPPSCFVVPGVLLGLFWHQSGYLMHDAEHHNVAGNERVNDILGWMYGTVCLGVNGAWWREEHREHHAFLNAYDSKGFKDPQMREDIWIQNKKLIPFFGDELIHFLTNFQHILFLPVIFLAGRVGIVIDSTVTERKFRPWTKLGNVCHVLLHYAVLCQAPRPVAVYIVASLWQAILSLQLLGNHYVKPWNYITDATEGNFFIWQILATQDFSCPKWARWFYGGLNFHYSHHCFPTLSREYFHLTTPLIRSLCEKHGLPFQEIAFVDCVKEMVANFDDVRKEFREHGRGSLALLYT